MKKIFLTYVFLGLAVGCGQKGASPTSEKELPGWQEIISTRSQRPLPENFRGLVFVTLETKALFATAKRGEDGLPVIDQKQSARLDAEQEKFLRSVAAVAPDIEVVYRYRFVANALALAVSLTDWEELQKLEELQGVQGVHIPQPLEMSKYRVVSSGEGGETTRFGQNSVRHIGAEKARKRLGLKGDGIRIGIIDSGIDYTHAALGGPGTPEAYQEVDPAGPSEYFPNDKVVGGIDLVGRWEGGTVPVPDENPIDEAGHGTHVAGSAAGIGDGVNTYSGVAPGALLYAIKAFGTGFDGTTDVVIMAGLEYAADPNRDKNPDDRLDVVNLSLSSPYGTPGGIYSRVMRNVVRSGMVVVTAVGNDGNRPYIVGSPASVEHAISVGGSIDSSYHNWKLPGVEFTFPDGQNLISLRAEGLLSKPVAKIVEEGGTPAGKLVAVGLADADLTAEVAESLKGNVALIDRGKVPFQDKLQRALVAGAVGAVVVNNEPEGGVFIMGMGGKVAIPAVMIDYESGERIKGEMEKGDVNVDFATEKRIERPELIDSLYPNTSRGPRSFDSLLKPEVVAPGLQVISAEAGTGSKGVAFSGTSMSAPHVTGLVALLKERFPHLSAEEHKSLLMNRARSLKGEDKKPFPLPLQGAGLVRALKSLEADFVVGPGAISLGEINVTSGKLLRRVVVLRNFSSEEHKFGVRGESSSPFLTVDPEVRVFSLKGGESRKIKVSFILKNEGERKAVESVEGRLIVSRAGARGKAVLPVFGVLRFLSGIQSQALIVRASDAEGAEGALAELTLENKGKNAGVVLPFNLLGTDVKKPSDPVEKDLYSRRCDLQAAGYRVIDRDGGSFLQIGVKLHNPLSHWDRCEVSVQVDTDGDEIAEQEFVGIRARGLPGLRKPPGNYSVLLDAAKVRDTLTQYEAMRKGAAGRKDLPSLDYSGAVLDDREMTIFGHSTVSIIEAPMDQFQYRRDGQLRVKLGVIVLSRDVVERDDFLGTEWMDINANPREHSYYDLPERVVLGPGEKLTVDVTKGEGGNPLILFMPRNKSVGLDGTVEDFQSQVLEPSFSL